MLNRESWALVRDALRFACDRHKGQLRKDGKTPYLDHLVRVSYLVRPVDPPIEVLCAALLHDTIEDTATSYDDLKSRFGTQVADLVAELSEDKRLPRDVRKQAADDGFHSLSHWAKVVALADTLDNLFDLEKATISVEKKKKQLERSEYRAQVMGDDLAELTALAETGSSEADRAASRTIRVARKPPGRYQLMPCVRTAD